MTLATESTSGDNLGKDAQVILDLVRELVDAGLSSERDALDAIGSAIQAFEYREDALAAIDEVHAYLDRRHVPEYPGGVTTDEGQPRTSPHVHEAPRPSQRVRPAPKLKDPSRRSTPRLPDGLGQAGAVEAE